MQDGLAGRFFVKFGASRVAGGGLGNHFRHRLGAWLDGELQKQLFGITSLRLHFGEHAGHRGNYRGALGTGCQALLGSQGQKQIPSQAATEPA